jgi:hypothetical protein
MGGLSQRGILNSWLKRGRGWKAAVSPGEDPAAEPSGTGPCGVAVFPGLFSVEVQALINISPVTKTGARIFLWNIHIPRVYRKTRRYDIIKRGP